ncbi:uncharacterized protein LACBIDRAFT_330128 [Laccaria bicolor S238N-H82]|uniref:Predicted protein n=1 Tax=Laccaria bicolor (strain S238N-H82 / ATCC MYA-4686) TaxID=486041 RepID=B0DKE0_LACBS|nr:uncharacterized protein LACBIDRAFT_330128 [Laccaria bicolor S238N-H82]EDR04927.1 predicted protein [Laccaria bicolor S238N-H82]|eukprot:XP_001884317.1 predicted protein [Laccaria bicolor S238N-H82]
MSRRAAQPTFSPLLRNIHYDDEQRLIYVHNPIINLDSIYHPCQVRLFLLFDSNLRNGVEVNTPPMGYLDFAHTVNMEPDILGTLSVTSGDDWDLPAIPLSHKDINLSCFAVDSGIIDPNLDALGFYRNGQLNMDQVNHHVRLALDRLCRYGDKGS